MKKILIFIWICLLFAMLSVKAQPGGDKVEALRVAFITKRIDLSQAESARFWPVYNEYNDKVRLIRKNVRQQYHQNRENINESQAEILYQLDLTSKQTEVEVHKTYSEKIKNIIGVKKFIKLRLAEEEFKRDLIKAID